MIFTNPYPVTTHDCKSYVSLLLQKCENLENWSDYYNLLLRVTFSTTQMDEMYCLLLWPVITIRSWTARKAQRKVVEKRDGKKDSCILCVHPLRGHLQLGAMAKQIRYLHQTDAWCCVTASLSHPASVRFQCVCVCVYFFHWLNTFEIM